MTKVLKPFYIDADVISDDDVEEICEVVESLGGIVYNGVADREDYNYFGVDGYNMRTMWYMCEYSYDGDTIHLKSMDEFREMFVEGYTPQNENIAGNSTQTEPDFITLMQKYINLHPDMPTEEDKKYIIRKMLELCENGLVKNIEL